MSLGTGHGSTNDRRASPGTVGKVASLGTDSAGGLCWHLSLNSLELERNTREGTALRVSNAAWKQVCWRWIQAMSCCWEPSAGAGWVGQAPHSPGFDCANSLCTAKGSANGGWVKLYLKLPLPHLVSWVWQYLIVCYFFSTCNRRQLEN